jgi:3-oxoacyl-[acyl-carrier protein] reductase
MAKQNGKVVLVTGSSRGIGAAIAERLASDGFAVVVNYVGDVAAAEALVGKIDGSGGRALAIKADVRDPAAVRAMFDTTEAKLGGIDVLVNNAGIMPLANIADMDDATFDRTLAINLKGTFNTLREAAKRLRSGGRIINISSSVVKLLQPTYGVYAATKAGVEAMTSVLTKELRGRNITVNTVAPGPTSTELFFNGKPQAVIDHLTKLSPLERLGQPEDIARVVSFFAGPDGAWVNGQVLRANGGVI